MKERISIDGHTVFDMLEELLPVTHIQERFLPLRSQQPRFGDDALNSPKVAV
jgi:hypothetical protein